MTPAAGRIRPLLCRLDLRRTEGWSGDAGGKSLLNLVEMRSDSIYGHSVWIRTTRRLPEFFESMGLLLSKSGEVQTRRFIHEAEDLVDESPNRIKNTVCCHE